MELRRRWFAPVGVALAAVLYAGCAGDAGTNGTSSTVTIAPAADNPNLPPGLRPGDVGKPPGNPKPPDNPNPPAGLVAYDLPNEGDKLDGQTQWERKLAKKCTDADRPPNCLTFRYRVLARVDGAWKNVGNPGPDYDPPYSECRVYDLDPDPGQVRVGTKIVVKIRCFAKGLDSGNGDNGNGDNGNGDNGDGGNGDGGNGDGGNTTAGGAGR